MTCVVDASIAVKWVVPEALSTKADELLAREGELLAPDLLLVEVANVLWKKTVRTELSARDADRAFTLLMQFGIDLRPSAPLLGRAMQLARLLGHPVYDCVYLVLAEREDATLVTADARLLDRVKQRRLRVPVVDLAAL